MTKLLIILFLFPVILFAQQSKIMLNDSALMLGTEGDSILTLGAPVVPVYTNAYYCDFDAIDYVSLDSQVALTGDFTISFWLYPQNFSSEYFLLGNSANRSYTQGTYFRIEFSGLYKVYSFDAPISINTWYHFAIVRSSGTVTIYKDGSAQADTESTSNDYDIDYLGASYNGASIDFNGYMDEIAIYDGTAISSGDASNLATKNGSEPGGYDPNDISNLTHHWNFEGDYDDKKGSNDGTAQNSPTLTAY